MISQGFSFMRDTNIVKYFLHLFALFQLFGCRCTFYGVDGSDECAHCRDVNNCFHINETCIECGSEDDLSSTSLIVLICILSTLLITTWILIAVYAFLKRRRGRLLVNETHGAVDICLADQDVPHHYDEVQDIDGCYTFLDRSAQETHYEDVNKI
nr:uncharacterized protein LOC117688251 [Crassostrea gigas]